MHSTVRACVLRVVPLLRSILTACLAIGAFAPSGAEPLKETHLRELVAACRTASKPLFLATDGSFLCFDSRVQPDFDDTLIDSLRPGGVFVVRSVGGEALEALKIAAKLQQKQATMVVYDYCLSACASFFLIAVERVHVVKDSIVAWHDGAVGEDLECITTTTVETLYGPQRQLTRSVCEHFLHGDDVDVKRYRQFQRMMENLYWKRTIENRIRRVPQSVHIRRKLVQYYDATGRYPEVLWMWNPRHYKSEIRTQVTYEAYPETQEEVDRLAARFGLGPILHDP